MAETSLTSRLFDFLLKDSTAGCAFKVMICANESCFCLVCFLRSQLVAMESSTNEFTQEFDRLPVTIECHIWMSVYLSGSKTAWNASWSPSRHSATSTRYQLSDLPNSPVAISRCVTNWNGNRRCCGRRSPDRPRCKQVGDPVMTNLIIISSPTLVVSCERCISIRKVLSNMWWFFHQEQAPLNCCG